MKKTIIYITVLTCFSLSSIAQERGPVNTNPIGTKGEPQAPHGTLSTSPIPGQYVSKSPREEMEANRGNIAPVKNTVPAATNETEKYVRKSIPGNATQTPQVNEEYTRQENKAPIQFPAEKYTRKTTGNIQAAPKVNAKPVSSQSQNENQMAAKTPTIHKKSESTVAVKTVAVISEDEKKMRAENKNNVQPAKPSDATSQELFSERNMKKSPAQKKIETTDDNQFSEKKMKSTK